MVHNVCGRRCGASFTTNRPNVCHGKCFCDLIFWDVLTVFCRHISKRLAARVNCPDTVQETWEKSKENSLPILHSRQKFIWEIQKKTPFPKLHFWRMVVDLINMTLASPATDWQALPLSCKLEKTKRPEKGWKMAGNFSEKVFSQIKVALPRAGGYCPTCQQTGKFYHPRLLLLPSRKELKTIIF